MVPKVIRLMEMTTKRTHSAVGTSRIRLPNWSKEEVQSIIGFLVMHTTGHSWYTIQARMIVSDQHCMQAIRGRW